ncbi:MAG: hypothetical protein WDW36_004929 [Sanguina aurantia]
MMLPGADKFVVTSTGFPSKERNALKYRLQQLGITYSGELVHGNGGTTHLLCYRLLDAFGSPKYNCALAWGVRIVSYNWIYESCSAGRLLPVGDFKTDSTLRDDQLLAADVQLAQAAEQQHLCRLSDSIHQVVEPKPRSSQDGPTLPHARLPLSPLPPNFVRASQLKPHISHQGPDQDCSMSPGQHQAEADGPPRTTLPVHPTSASHDAFTFATPTHRHNPAHPSSPSLEAPSRCVGNLETARAVLAFDADPCLPTAHDARRPHARFASMQAHSAHQAQPATGTEQGRLQPHTQPKGCLAQCLASEVPAAVQTSLDRLHLGRRGKAEGSLGAGASLHPGSIDDIIPPTPGADYDSWQHGIVVAGTQGNLAPTQARQQVHVLPPGTSVCSLPDFWHHTLCLASCAIALTCLHSPSDGGRDPPVRSPGPLPASEPASPSLSFPRRPDPAAHTPSPMATSPLPRTCPTSPMQSSPPPYPYAYPPSPMALSPAPPMSPSPPTPAAAAQHQPSHASSPMVLSPSPYATPPTHLSSGEAIDLVTPAACVARLAAAQPSGPGGPVLGGPITAASQQHSNRLHGAACAVSDAGDVAARDVDGMGPLTSRLQRVLLREAASQAAGQAHSQLHGASLGRQQQGQQACEGGVGGGGAGIGRGPMAAVHRDQQRSTAPGAPAAAATAVCGLLAGEQAATGSVGHNPTPPDAPSASAPSSSIDKQSRHTHGPATASTPASSSAPRVTPADTCQQPEAQASQAGSAQLATAPVHSATAVRVGRRLVRNSTAPPESSQQSKRLSDGGQASQGGDRDLSQQQQQQQQRQQQRQQRQQQDEEDEGMRELEDDVSDCGESNGARAGVCDRTAGTMRMGKGAGAGCSAAGAAVLRVGGRGVAAAGVALKDAGHDRPDGAGAGAEQMDTGGSSLGNGPMPGNSVQASSNQHTTTQPATPSSGTHSLKPSSQLKPGCPTPVPVSALEPASRLKPGLPMPTAPSALEPVVLGAAGHVTVRSRHGRNTPNKAADSHTPGGCVTMDAGTVSDSARIVPARHPDARPSIPKAAPTSRGTANYDGIAVKQEMTGGAEQLPRAGVKPQAVHHSSATPARPSSAVAALVARVTAASSSASSSKAAPPAAAAVVIKAERRSVTPEAAGQGMGTGPMHGAETIARVLGGRSAALTPLDPAMALAITPLQPGASGFAEEAGDSPCSTFDSRRQSPDQRGRDTRAVDDDDDETDEDDSSAGLGAQGAALPGHAQHEGLSMFLRKTLLASRSAPGLSGGGLVTVVKGLSRPTRSNTVREVHTGVHIKTVEFAEQIQIESLQLLINCRDRSRRTHCPIVILKDGVSGDTRAAVMEPYALYKLPSGEWWVEGYRFYTAADIQSLATASSTTLHLPTDFHCKHELLRDTDRLHARLSEVIGELAVMRTKKLPSKWARGERPAFCRYVFDATLRVVLTDQPATDFIIGA